MRRPMGMVLAMLFGASALPADTVQLEVHDRSGRPIAGAEAVVSFDQWDTRIWQGVTAETDTDGRMMAEGTTPLGFDIQVSKEGYYRAHLLNLPAADRLDQTIILPSRRNPIPLFAKRVSLAGEKAEALLRGEWLGYDFEAGDWVAPEGKGRIADIRFRFRHEFVGFPDWIRDLEREREDLKEILIGRGMEWSEEVFKLRRGSWRAELQVSFPEDGEGMVQVTDDYLSYSEMPMPHEAPDSGYDGTWRYTTDNFSGKKARDDLGYFVRTRVRHNARGEIVSAHYAKIAGDFNFLAPGALYFTYYFNPVPNERNLEFDIQRNLFPGLPIGESVRIP